MAAKTDNQQTIIIKRARKGGQHEAHHSGAWKVAYADFVTAMMAFFLLLWLLNTTTDDQKRGIADYFSPNSASQTHSGSGRPLAGSSFAQWGSRVSDQGAVGMTLALPGLELEGQDDETRREDQADSGTRRELPESLRGVSEHDLDLERARREISQFAAAERELRQAIQSVPELRELATNLLIDQTKEGLRIQIVDQASYSMFPLGSAVMYDKTRQLISLVASAIRDLPQPIAIKGHTDAKAYAGGRDYSNWELSSDRANACRRALIEAGLDAQRVDSVVGLAAQEPLIAEDPYSPANRRISIILLREGSLGAAS